MVRVMSFSGKTRRQREKTRCTKHTWSELRCFHQRLDAIASHRGGRQHELVPLLPYGPSVLETPPASLAAASLYLVSRVWKTLNGFLMTWSRGRDAC